MLSDFVIVTSHTHGGNKNVEPPSWQPGFAKECIDAGAIAYVSHGPHRLRGIEIYKGKPIFYSLGNFIFQNETIDPMPADNYERYDLPPDKLAGELYDKRFKGGTVGFPSEAIWYESIIAVPTFSKGKLVELKLYPIELNQKAPRSQRGTPRMAYGENAEKIIKRLAQLSEPLGIRIEFKNGIGVWVRK
jgi:poly-gamma-glutamate synthesis protein (capsule biosynthesis protein)